MKRFLVFSLLIIAILGIVFAMGPRETITGDHAFDPTALGQDLDAYLAEQESKIPDITEGAEKSIIWANPETKAKTALSVVYIHGFSATLMEVRPLPDLVADALDANLFYTRLGGHGRTGQAMAEVSGDDWYYDVQEALAIGKRLGEKVLLISTSTGGTLVTWALEDQNLAEDVIGTVMISPNYAVQAAGADALLMPWARQLMPLIFGKERSFEPSNEEHGRWWTTQYPTVSLMPMQATVARAAKVGVEEISVPAQFIFHPNDRVVKASVTKDIAARWGKNTGAKSEVVEIERSDDDYYHVIAGDIKSPSTTQPLAETIITWVKGL